MNYSYINVPGYTNERDFEELYKICQDSPDSGVLLELGTFFGRSALFFAETFRNLNKNYKIYTVDYFPSNILNIMKRDKISGDVRLLEPLNHNNSMVSLVKTFCSEYPEITVLKHNIFIHYPKELKNLKFNVVFEDSEHTYASTKQCLETYYPKVEKNGIYAGDDYDWAEVKLAADRFALENNLKLSTDGKIWRLGEIGGNE